MARTNSFLSNADFEQRCVGTILDWLEPRLAEKDPSLRATLTQRAGDPHTKRGLDADLQKKMGDMIISKGRHIFRTVDFKCERKTSRNFFVETYSNRTGEDGRLAAGWLYHLETDQIWYYFADSGQLFRINRLAFKAWLHELIVAPDGKQSQRISSFQERPQTQHAQKNVTIGRLVPIEMAQKASFDGVPVIECVNTIPSALPARTDDQSLSRAA